MDDLTEFDLSLVPSSFVRLFQTTLQERESCKPSSILHRDLCPVLPARYVLVIIAGLGFVNVYALRVNLSMAIVAMVNNTADHSTRLHYNWSSKQEGWVLSSFFLGYIITQIPGGYLASRFGGRHVFGTGILVTSVLTLLTPLAAEVHIGVLIALRVLEGFFEGVTFPAMHALLGRWSPVKERSIMAAIVYTGPITGNVISFPLSAVLCEYGFAGGWPSVFYVFGSVGVVWYVFWLLLGYSSPATHPRISEKEKKYIESCIGESTNENGTPWFSIMTSPAVWAIIVSYLCFNWASYTLLTCIPLYFKEALGLSFGKSLISNGIYSAIPYAAFAVVSMISGQVADFLRRKGLSTALVRKIFSASAFFLAAGGLLSVGYIGSDKLVSVLFLTISVGCSALSVAGHNVNHIDLAPQYAGVLMGITNTAGTLPGIIAPVVAKMIAHEPSHGEKDMSVYQDEWREVFLLSAEVYIFGALIYIILGRGERQWWAATTNEGVGPGEEKGQQKIERNFSNSHYSTSGSIMGYHSSTINTKVS